MQKSDFGQEKSGPWQHKQNLHIPHVQWESPSAFAPISLYPLDFEYPKKHKPGDTEDVTFCKEEKGTGIHYKVPSS